MTHYRESWREVPGQWDVSADLFWGVAEWGSWREAELRAPGGFLGMGILQTPLAVRAAKKSLECICWWIVKFWQDYSSSCAEVLIPPSLSYNCPSQISHLPLKISKVGTAAPDPCYDILVWILHPKENLWNSKFIGIGGTKRSLKPFLCGHFSNTPCFLPCSVQTPFYWFITFRTQVFFKKIIIVACSLPLPYFTLGSSVFSQHSELNILWVMSVPGSRNTSWDHCCSLNTCWGIPSPPLSAWHRLKISC